MDSDLSSFFSTYAREVYEDYTASRAIIKSALQLEKRGNKELAVCQYESTIAMLERTLDRNLDKTFVREVGAILMLIKKAIECCRVRTFVLDGYRKSVLRQQNSSLPVIDQNHSEELTIPGGVQLFLVNQNDELAALTNGPMPLQVILSRDDRFPAAETEAQCFIQVDNWIYNLSANPKGVLSLPNGLYVFPFNEEIPESPNSTDYHAFGIVISNEIADDLVESFLGIIEKYSTFQGELSCPSYSGPTCNLCKTVRYAPFSDDVELFGESSGGKFISKKIDQGAEMICGGLMKSAEIASSLITFGSKTIKRSVMPVIADPPEVSESVRRSAQLANNFATASVQATELLVDSVGRLQAAATNTISSITTSLGLSNPDAPPNPVVDNILTVANASSKGMTKVLASVENATGKVTMAACNATVDNINHSYGPEAAKLASQATDVAMCVGTCVGSIQKMSFQLSKKQALQEAGLEFLNNYSNKNPVVSYSLKR